MMRCSKSQLGGEEGGEESEGSRRSEGSEGVFCHAQPRCAGVGLCPVFGVLVFCFVLDDCLCHVC